MRTVILHIGINKTGTTAIQYHLSQYRDELKSLGVLYPRAGCNGWAHHSLSQALGFTLPSTRPFEDLAAARHAMRRELDKEVTQAAVPILLLSSEIFVRPANLEIVREFFANDNVLVLVYLRRHDHWIPALYSQALTFAMNHNVALKWNPVGIEGFIRLQRRRGLIHAYYRQLLDRWAVTFGRENIFVRPYESSQNKPDIFFDFLNSINKVAQLAPDQILQLTDFSSKRYNTSPAPCTLQLLDIFLRIKTSPDICQRLVQHALSRPVAENRTHLLPPARRLELIKENSADYDYIAREYMGRSDGQLFYDPLPDPNEAWHPPTLTQLEIVEETISALSVENRNNRNLVSRFSRSAMNIRKMIQSVYAYFK